MTSDNGGDKHAGLERGFNSRESKKRIGHVYEFPTRYFYMSLVKVHLKEDLEIFISSSKSIIFHVINALFVQCAF